MISTKQNYEIHDQELLAIIIVFKQWRHYLKSSAYLIEMWSNHNNLKDFMKQKKLNFKQARWALALTTYDFEIFHHLKTRNLANESSKRLDYEEVSSLNIKLLSTLQYKLALSFDEKSLTQNERKNSMNSIFVFYLTNVQTSAIDERYSSSQSKRKILEALASMFQLIERRENGKSAPGPQNSRWPGAGPGASELAPAMPRAGPERANQPIYRPLRLPLPSKLSKKT